jgi:hypothetical protein
MTGATRFVDFNQLLNFRIVPPPCVIRRDNPSLNNPAQVTESMGGAQTIHLLFELFWIGSSGEFLAIAIA